MEMVFFFKRMVQNSEEHSLTTKDTGKDSILIWTTTKSSNKFTKMENSFHKVRKHNNQNMILCKLERFNLLINQPNHKIGSYYQCKTWYMFHAIPSIVHNPYLLNTKCLTLWSRSLQLGKKMIKIIFQKQSLKYRINLIHSY
jgi:hypothetical protein